MANPSPAQLEEILIEQTISLGGNSELSRLFSLEEVAKSCDISCHAAAALFKNKDALLARAGVKVYEALSEEALRLAGEEEEIHGFLNHYLDFLLSHPTLVYFTLNFGHGVPHIAPLSDDGLVHRVKVIGDAETILSRYGLEPKEDYLLLWSFTLRHLLYFAGYLLNDPQHDSPEMREESEHIILEGLKAFKENR
jgi:AcrR family transcriptional regulator